MATILNLETATTNCSVSIAREGQTIAIREENSASYSHAEQLHVFIEDCLKQAGLSVSDLDAVAVSEGPGSYTGLRIGVSAAKGLCYSLDIPLISVPTLKSMASSINQEEGYIIPLLDARRMEVYAAVFDHKHRQVKSVWAEIITASSFEDFIHDEKVCLVGSGAEKCRNILKHPHVSFNTEVLPSADFMSRLSYRSFQDKNFQNTAYFEPYYLKNFIAGKAKKTTN